MSHDWQRRLTIASMKLTLTDNPSPRRGEIWTANIGEPPTRHWVLIVSVDVRNLSRHVDSILTVPFSSSGCEGPTVLKLGPGETGLPATHYLSGDSIDTIKKSRLIEQHPRTLSETRMREVVRVIRRAFDPDAP